MIYSTERVTANNIESFMFILFLLCFAVAAAVYVWMRGVEDPDRNKYKLLLECVLIITAVVPPELPMELSLAVNTALMSLSRFAIFCTEPFRIPFAGKIDVCCFDKTGTLTDEKLVVAGVAGLEIGVLGLDSKRDVSLCSKGIPFNSSVVMAFCQSLLILKESVVGDPMEQAALDFSGWKLQREDSLVSKNGRDHGKILKRYAFSSALKRMSAICQLSCSNSHFVVTKGAPEVLKEMLARVPSNYDEIYEHFAMQGSRVIALASKEIALKPAQFPRESAESGLTFRGFLVFHCPIKADSKNAVVMLQKSSHKIVVITGDNHLTAVHVAKELGITGKSVVNISLTNDHEHALDSATMSGNEKELEFHVDFVGIKEKKSLNLKIGDRFPEELADYDKSITGAAIDVFLEKYPSLVPFVSVYARASPSQKELILTTLKEQGFTTLMCGDGTNDVGALKQSHVGVALLDGKPEDLDKILQQARKEMLKKRQQELAKAQEDLARRFGGNVPARLNSNFESSLIEDNEPPMVKLGDASVAAPFTSKIATIESVCNIVRQGRCTLVTTIQMYKILALNSLISAYSLSVLHLDGIRYGDFQVTITGMLLAGCFLFLSKSKPLKELSEKRPHSNIFNLYIISSVLLQFAVHVMALIYVTFHAKRQIFMRKLEEDLKFEPNLLNTAVFLLSLSMQVSTFVVNYQGRPFRESLLDNKPLRNSLAIVGAVSFICALELFPDFNEWLELVVFPIPFKVQLLAAMILDFGLCWVIELCCFYLFADSRSKLSKLGRK